VSDRRRSLLPRLGRAENGPTLAEYLLALGLIGFLAVAALFVFGDGVSQVLSTVSGSV
jgi:Flp pilus assembly pilin Flp